MRQHGRLWQRGLQNLPQEIARAGARDEHDRRLRATPACADHSQQSRMACGAAQVAVVLAVLDGGFDVCSSAGSSR